MEPAAVHRTLPNLSRHWIATEDFGDKMIRFSFKNVCRFSTTSSLHALANAETPGFKQAARLVPRSSKVCLIRDGVATQAIDLSSLEVGPNQCIKVLNVHPQPGPDSDPKVVVQIAENVAPGPKHAEKQKKPKKAAIKNVQISWNISENDLMGQKRGALESILSRGHIASITLQPKNRSDPPPSDNQLESREKLLFKLEQILQASGSQIKKPEGNLMTQLTLVWGPKAKE